MTLGWQSGDRIFERLTEVSEAMDEAELEAFLARLVFLLANEVDDAARVLASIDAAVSAQRPAR